MITKYVCGETFRLEKYEITDDMTDPAVLMRRGTIFDNRTNEIVCRGFDKFFNLGEVYAASIDWPSARVIEKIDGTNIRIGYWGNQWRISTLGVADVINEPAESSDCDFGALTMQAIETHMPWATFTSYLNPIYTYIFELTSEQNRLVVNYDSTPILWFLGRRRVSDGIEDCVWPEELHNVVRYPRTFALSTPEEVVAYLDTTDNFEGVVVVDKNWHRVKMKAAKYLQTFHKLSVGNRITDKRLLTFLREGILDDFTPVIPEAVNRFMTRYNALVDALEMEYTQKIGLCTDRVSVTTVVAPFCRGYCWYRMDHPEVTAKDWLNTCSRRSVLATLKHY